MFASGRTSSVKNCYSMSKIKSYDGFSSLSDERWPPREWRLNACYCCAARLLLGCEYGNNDWSGSCSSIQQQDCYDANVRQRCCVTCDAMRNKMAPANCEFGDKATWCAAPLLPAHQCYTEALSTCCYSCNKFYTGISGNNIIKYRITLINRYRVPYWPINMPAGAPHWPCR